MSVDVALSTNDRPILRGLLSLRQGGVLLLVIILAALTLYPMGMLLYGSFHSTPPGSAGNFNLEGYRGLFTAATGKILLDTAALSAAHTAFSLPFAVLLAFLVARTDLPGRGSFEVLLTLPFFLPPILTAMAWGMLGNGQVGSINLLWETLTGSDEPLFNIYGRGGVIWHMCQYSIPFLFLILVDAFKAMDPSLEDSSRMCGASTWRTIRSITLAMLLPALSSAFLLSFTRGLEAFESALIFGAPAKIEVATTAIYDAIHQRSESDYQYATALSFAVFGIMLLLIVLQWRLLGNRSFQTVTGKGYMPRLFHLGRWRGLAFALCALTFLIMTVLPAAQLLVGSFFQYFGFYSLDMLTLNNYRAVLSDRVFWRALGNTFLLGVLGATATMILGAAVAYVVIRTRHPFRRGLDALAWLPWMMPGMVLGIGLLWSFALLPGPVQIYGTIWALFVAYVSLGTPLATQIMSASFAQLSFDIEECSRVHGASALTTMRRIVIALVYPAFMVGWTLTFFMILRELSASILLYSPDSMVLSVVVMQLWSGGKAEQCSVIALIMLVLVLLIRFAQLKLFRRQIGGI